ncbi:MAG TPA: hypothetical protein VMR74_16755 [Gammaproteobacteria bacterium]|nr:hypothetical protein [Gammaproteobacteria bacterium]
MLRNLWWIAALPALNACSEPAFEFRGYSDRSNCTGIIDAELANGARYDGVFASEDPENPAQTVELSATLFSENVRINVTCTAGRVDSIQYVSQASDPVETGAIFAKFAAELEALFGEPTAIASDRARSLRYFCHSPAPVLLEEWRLLAEGDEEGEDEVVEHEVYVAVVPGAAECLRANAATRVAGVRSRPSDELASAEGFDDRGLSPAQARRDMLQDRP